jgi:hypothetical protein
MAHRNTSARSKSATPVTSSDAERYTVDDLIQIAKVDRNQKAEARRYLLAKIERLKRHVSLVRDIPKPAEYNKRLGRLTKKLSAARHDLKLFKRQYPAQFRGIRLGDPSASPLGGDIENLLNAFVDLLQRDKMPPSKPKDFARYFVARFAYYFFIQFSPIRASYGDSSANRFIDFCQALSEVVTGKEAQMATYARIVISEARGKRKSLVKDG